MKIQGNKGTLLLSESTLFFVSVVFKGSFFRTQRFPFLSCGYNSHIDIFNVPLLILRNKTLRKRVLEVPLLAQSDEIVFKQHCG